MCAGALATKPNKWKGIIKKGEKMKRLLLLLVFLLMIAPVWILIGCGQDEQKQVTTEQAKEEIEEAADAAVAVTQHEMDDFVDMMESQLALFEERVEEIEIKSEELTGDAKQTINEKLVAIKEKQQQFETELDQIKSASDEAWDELKMGVQAAMFELKQAADDVAAEF